MESPRIPSELSAPKKTKEAVPSTPITSVSSSQWLQLAFLRFEKCDLEEAYQAFLAALERAKIEKQPRTIAEAISGLLRFSGEAFQTDWIDHWEKELDQMILTYPDQTPPLAWYCKGNIAFLKEDLLKAQRYFHRFVRQVRSEKIYLPSVADEMRHFHGESSDQLVAKGLVALSNTLQRRGNLRRSRWIANEILKQYPEGSIKGVRGIAYMILATTEENAGNLDSAWALCQKAHSSFLMEHNWYHHLFAMIGYARIELLRKNFKEAEWYLSLIEKVAEGPYFGYLKQNIAKERKRLRAASIDIEINPYRGEILLKNREPIKVGKQFILIEILKALTDHLDSPASNPDGLTKEELIEKVWKESYRPESHDNKIYFNINRLRKLLEKDVHSPKMIMHSRDGYRFAPGLKVKWVSEELSKPSKQRRSQ